MHGGGYYSCDIDIDFSVNLNPYPKSAKEDAVIQAALEEGLGNASKYPDIFQTDVRTAVSDAEGVDAGCVYAANGASELIMAVTLMTAPQKALLVAPGYTGYEYALTARNGCRIIRYFLNEEKDFRPGRDILEMITDDTDILYLQDPVNPTGRNIDGTLLSDILDKANRCYVTVLYDRSFYMLSDGFGRKGLSGNELINRYDNLYLVSSYTKSFALPGIRMGYVMPA